MKNRHYTILILVLIISPFLSNTLLLAQRKMEKMDRGVVVMAKSNSQLYISWRYFATDPEEISFNVYREVGSNVTKLNSSPIAGATNFLWNVSGTGLSVPSRIFVKPVINGIEDDESGSWNLKANLPATRIVKDINYQPLPSPEYDGLRMNMKFCWPADLNGDGKFDFVIDRQNYGAVTDEEGSDAVDYASPFVEAYTSEGEFMWRIKIGTNLKIADGAGDMVTAYDMDGDGFAEVMLVVSEGAVFPNGQQIKNSDGTVHNYNHSIGSAPQWIAIVNGQTGNLIDKIELARFTELQNTRTDKWKNINGRFVIAYLDGINPSLLYQYKSRLADGRFIGAIDAVSLKNGSLVREWSSRFQKENTQYDGHNVRVADVDGDGKDEFIEQSYAFDHDGSVLYYVPGIAHGDRQTLADVDPDRPGLEHFFIQQSNIMGMGLNDAATGEILKGFYMASVGDVGRSTCGAFDTKRRGMQFWSTMNGFTMYDASGNATGGTGVFPCEPLWWGPDLSRWHVASADGNGFNLFLQYYNGSGFSRDFPNFYAEGGDYYLTAMYGKRAAFWGDMIGDWREEMILPRRDASGFAVVSTWEVTNHRQYCLMQNPAYRGQTTARGYYQTADVDFYMAADMPLPPIAPVQQADLYFNGTGWIGNDDVPANYSDGKSIMFDIRGGGSTFTITNDMSPSRVWIINPKGYDYTFNGNGKLTGEMELIKSLQGNAVLNGNHDYTGITRISEGRLFVNGTLASPVHVNARGIIGGNGKLNNGVTFETGLNVEGGRIEAGNGEHLGNLTIVGNVDFPGRNNLHFDIDQTNPIKNDSLIILGDFLVTGNNHSFVFNQISPIQEDTLTLITYSGITNATVDNFKVRGLEGIPFILLFEQNKIKLVLSEARSAGVVTWSGNENSSWNFQTKNFINNGTADFFVPGDKVYFNDNASRKTIILSESMPVAGLEFNNETTYSLSGTGVISGDGGIKKTGSGKVSLLMLENSFTGGIDFSDGILTVSSLKNGGLPSSIGASSSDAVNWKMTNATLQTTAAMSTDRNMQVVGKLTVDNPVSSNSVFISGNISGTDISLEVSGLGNLTLSGENNFKQIYVKSGKLISGSANGNKTAFGTAKITLEGGVLQMYDVNTTTITGPWTNEIIVPEGKSAVWNLPSRWILNNKISGSGTLTINAPYVRSDFNNNWSGFTGRVNFTGRDIRLNNTDARNMVNVHVDLGSGTGVSCASNGGSSTSAQTVTFGALSGSGNMHGINTYIIGAKNLNTTYSGIIGEGGGKLTKTGTGTLFLSGSNLYTGGTTISQGTLSVVNTSGSATGTGNVSVTNDALIMGTGTIGGNLIMSNTSSVRPGATETGIGTLSVDKNLTLTANSTAIIKANKTSNDKLKVGGILYLNGTLDMRNLGGLVWSNGMEFKFLDAATINGNFSAIVPEAPGANLVWDTSRISEGIIAVKTISGVKRIDASLVDIYPQPVDDFCNISIENEDASSIIVELFNSNGAREIVKSEQTAFGQIKLNTASLPSGIYLLRITNIEGAVFMHKLIKQ